MSQTVWQLNVFLQTPMALEIVEPADVLGGFPKKFGERRPLFDNIFPVKVSDGLHINISPFVDEREWIITVNSAPARAFLTYAGSGADTDAILRGAEPYVEEAIDQLAFLWDYPVTAYRAELVDVTLPAEVGEQRAFHSFANYRTPKFQQTNFHGMDPLQFSSLPDTSLLSGKLRAALRWYAIGTQRQGDVQRYMALWVTLDLLVQQSTEAIKLPYKASCGHEIPNCPICSKPTHRAVGGAQFQEYLVNHGGLSPEAAKALWRTRQMIHGANRLLPENAKELPDRLSELWNVTRRMLGSHLGATIAPGAGKPVGTSMVTVSGTRALTLSDLDETIRTFPLFSWPLQRIEMPVAGR